MLGTYDVVFRLLTTDHRRAVHNKAATRNQSPIAYEDDVRVLTLARAIVTINGVTLALDPVEKEAAKKALGLRPNEELDDITCAELILTERFTIRVLAAIDAAYEAWILEYEAKAIEEVKKKLGRAASGTTTFDSSTAGGSSPETSDSTS